jgi:hypothetical protein
MKNILFLFLLLGLYSCVKEKSEVVLDKPTNLKVSKGLFSNKIVVQWDSMLNAKSYQLYRFDPKIGDYTLLSLTNRSVYIDSVFVVSAKQYYKVRIFNSESSFGDFSDINYGYTNLYIGDNPLIDKPIQFKVSKGIYGDKILLSWVKPPKALTYQIYKFDLTSNNYDLFATTKDTLFEDKTITTSYSKMFYKVRVFNSDSAYSSFTDADYGYINGKAYDLVSYFGSEGTGNGQFSFPEHLAIDQNDNIYVSDPNNNRIQKFDKNGNFIENFYSCSSPRSVLFLTDMIIIAKSGDNKIYEMDYNKQFIRDWGSSGTGDGQFNYFRQVAIDNENKIYVVDHNNNRIQKFDLNGNFILKWGSQGETAGNFVYPWGIAFINNKIMVSSGTRVQFFTKTGEYLKQWDLGATIYDIRVKGDDIYLACGGYILKTNENRDIEIKIGEGDFDLVSSVVIDSNNNLYANDVYKRRVSLYKMNNISSTQQSATAIRVLLDNPSLSALTKLLLGRP